MSKGLVYLASPYTAKTAKQREQRFRAVCKKAAELMLAGEEIFCPIAHSHPIEVHGMDERQSGDFWLRQDFAVLDSCKKMIVYCMPGWQESKGIAREVEFATAKGIPIEFIE